MSSAPLILLADDCADALDVVEADLRDAGFEVARAGDGRHAWERFRERMPDLVVSDVRMPEIDGFDLLEKIRRVSDVPMILLTAYGEISHAVLAIRKGADDYLRFPDDLGNLVSRVRDLLTRNPEEATDPATQLLAGTSKAARELRARVRALGALQIPVLVCGEHGTGRARVVRALHACSELRELPLVPWETALAEVPARPCVVYIEEIERMEREQQGRWLAEIRRIGQRKPGAVARVLASASPLLYEEVASRRFHPELWSALSRFQLQVAPLRDRAEDLEALARDLLLETARRLGRPHLALSPGALGELRTRSWPGNVRELRDVLEQSVALEPSERVGVEAVRAAVEEVIAKRGDSLETHRATRHSLQRKELIDLLNECGGNIAEMARRLSLTRGAVVYRLQKHGLMT
jgi:two-component system response regulator HydG